MSGGRKISVDSLASLVTYELSHYDQDVAEALAEECLEIAKEGVKELKKTSPQETKRYAKGWRVSVTYRSFTDFRYRIHNQGRYQITHLLEFGHVVKNGTARVYGRVEGKVHIKPVEDEINRQLQGRVKSRIMRII